MTFSIRPIGRVRGGSIRLHKRWSKALDGIEGFSHIIVLFWLDQAHKPDLRLHPKGIKHLPKVGYLASRTPHRFNPIGVTVVPLRARRLNILQVEGLDAWEGTPVLDIKPYTKKDSIRKLHIPDWVKILDKLEKDPLRRYGN